MQNDAEVLNEPLEPETIDDQNSVEGETDTTPAPLAVPSSPQVQLALAGINAETLKKYLYTFHSRGEEVVDVTQDGINHIAQRAGVSSEDVEILHEDDVSITVKATAINENGVRHIGMIREEKFNKSGYPNPFALQNAVSKAQRNAKKGLLPMTWIRDLIKQATGGMPTVDEIEGRLENAKDHYRDQKAEIDRLTKENEELRSQLETESA